MITFINLMVIIIICLALNLLRISIKQYRQGLMPRDSLEIILYTCAVMVVIPVAVALTYGN